MTFPNAGTPRLLERLAWGKVATVYRATLQGQEVAVKVYRPRYVRRHAERHPVAIAEYEYTRNLAFRHSADLARYAAEPIDFLDSPSVSGFVQELIHGEMYYDACVRRGGPIDSVFTHIERIVDLAHARGLYDIDLHAMNVLIVDDGGEEIPKLFDFNRIPFYMDPRNPLEAAALRLGIIDERTRDRKKLRQFHNFRKLLRRRARFLPDRDEATRTGQSTPL
ncbi:MAG: hypothetical protein ACC682_08075 [Gemmatimonadota bacterium]